MMNPHRLLANTHKHSYNKQPMSYEAQLAAELFCKMTYKPSKLRQSDLLLVCDQISSVGLCMQDYKSAYSGYNLCHPG